MSRWTLAALLAKGFVDPDAHRRPGIRPPPPAERDQSIWSWLPPTVAPARVFCQAFIAHTPGTKERARYDPRSGRFYTPTRTKRQESSLADIVCVQNPHLVCNLADPLGTVLWLFPRTNVRGDTDNLEKLLWDSLNHVVWRDDKQIVEVHKRIRLDPSFPRTELLVYTIPDDAA